MTNEEKQEIIAAVLSSIRTNSKTIDQLTEVIEVSDDDYIEISGGRKVSFAVLLASLNDALGDVVNANDLQAALNNYTTSQAIFEYIISHMASLDTNASNLEREGAPLAATLCWQQSPVVFLESMGSTLDDIDGGTFGYTPAVGDLYFDNQNGYQIWQKISSTSSGKTGYYAKTSVVYVNKHTLRMYQWSGSAMVEIGGTGINKYRVLDYMTIPDLNSMAVGDVGFNVSNKKITVKTGASQWFSFPPDPRAVYCDKASLRTVVWDATQEEWIPVGGSGSGDIDAEAVNALVDFFGSGGTISETYDESDCTTEGFINLNNNGTVSTAYSGFRRSDFISIPSGVTAYSWTQNYGTSGKSSGIAFYSSNAADGSGYISGTKATEGSVTPKTYSGSIPTGAKYVRFTVSDGVTNPVSTLVLTGTSSGVEGWETAFKAEILEDVEEMIEGATPGGGTTSGTLKILCIGNSFTKNTMEYMASICTNLQVPSSSVSLHRLYHNGSGLADWLGKGSDEDFNVPTGTSLTTIKVLGSGSAYSGTLPQILAKDWDIVVLQQASADADNYATYEPYLSELINLVLTNCTNKAVRFAWLMTWETSEANYNDQDNRLTVASDANANQNIIKAVKSLKENYGHLFDYILPVGTAIENIRNSSVNDSNAHNFTRDSKHLNMGVGDYVAGCTFYAAVLQPHTGKLIYNDTTTTNGEHDAQSATGAVDVTSNNRAKCQKSAVYAVIHPWAPTDIENV